MKSLVISTVTYVSKQEAYDFLLDFPSYTAYTEYMTGVEKYGDGMRDTEYDIEFSWWKLTYTTRTRVTDVDEPNEISWAVQKDIDAQGKWVIEEAEEEPPEDSEYATRVSLVINYDDRSVTSDIIDLPRFVSLDWVVEKASPLVVEEGERVVERAVADLEGKQRDVQIDVDFDRPTA